MKHHFENISKKIGRTIRHWWLMLIVGILAVIAGILVFVFPLETYVSLSILFGVLMVLVGAAQLIVASSSNNYLMMRGYVIVGGVLDVILGLFLCLSLLRRLFLFFSSPSSPKLSASASAGTSSATIGMSQEFTGSSSSSSSTGT